MSDSMREWGANRDKPEAASPADASRSALRAQEEEDADDSEDSAELRADYAAWLKWRADHPRIDMAALRALVATWREGAELYRRRAIGAKGWQYRIAMQLSKCADDLAALLAQDEPKG